ncbi:hypothetical protein HK107_14315 [Parvularcula sp. ZS-1/3]|uniref:Uncharacterized protein n=2 Tax=Parvularcula mediterranea TaxID=2732508 RepID=A0A7Y3RNT9_9PROT|nr:hypothetical protein [Parvularcula mediterranea]
MSVYAQKHADRSEPTRMEQLGLSLVVEPGRWSDGNSLERRERLTARVEAWLEGCESGQREAGLALRNSLKAEGFRLIDGWGEPVFEEE